MATTYQEARLEDIKQPIIVVELDLDYCALDFGILPCTATANTNDEKCRNTFLTCRDRQNFFKTIFTYQFIELSADIPPNVNAFPCVERVETAPTVRNPSEGLGARASVKVTCMDFPWHDRGIDKYESERSWDYNEQGTFFGRLIAGNPYYEGRPMRIRYGFIEDPWNWAVFEDRAYLIDKIDGPDSNGRVVIRAKDPLKALDEGRAEYPGPTDSELTQSINRNATSFGVTNIQFFSANDYIVINNEAMLVGTVNVGGSQLENVTRGIGDTTSQNHSSGDSIQITGVYTLQNCIDVARDLLIDKANISPSYIDDTAWDQVRDDWFTGFDVFRIIPEPTSVNELLSSLMEQCGFDIWWDERQQKIIVKAIAPSQSNVVYDDNNSFLQDSIKLEKQQDKRISQIWYYWDKDSILEDDRPQAFNRVTVFGSGQTANQYPEPRIRRIWGSWIQDGGALIVNTVGQRTLNRFKEPPIKVQFDLDQKDGQLWTGSDFVFNSRTLQDPFGNNSGINCEVLEAAEIDNIFRYTAQFTSLASTRFGEIAPNALGITYETANQTQRDTYVFISGNDGLMSDGTAGYAIQ